MTKLLYNEPAAETAAFPRVLSYKGKRQTAEKAGGVTACIHPRMNGLRCAGAGGDGAPDGSGIIL